MDASVWLFLALGLALLALGGELLVRGSSSLARRFGVSPLVIGLTVVAFGTSAPELVVSALATLEGKPELAVGNVVGSNVFNVLFILGLCALLRPLVVARQIVRREVPWMIAASLALWFFGLDGRLGLGEGLLSCGALAWFTLDSIRASRREQAVSTPAAGPARTAHPLAAVGQVALGLGLLVLGARWLVDSAIAIATGLGLDETVIALTIVAAGTSLPEVATSLVATLRGERDIAVGNVIGSNLFNILGIAGLTALVAGGDLPVAPAIENFDVPVMVAVAVACLPILGRKHLLARWEGAVFLAYYAAYTAYLVLDAQGHAALPRFGAVMLEFVLPLTVLTFGVLIVRARRPERGEGGTG
ncbi:MAG TPA: calcium/sodium antiporter [Planctomycetota bacterium]